MRRYISVELCMDIKHFPAFIQTISVYYFIPVPFVAPTSRLPIDTFETVVGLAQDGCKAIAEFMREKLLEHTKRLSLAKGAVRV